MAGIDAFKSDKIRPNILKLLLDQDVVRRYTLEETQTRSHFLYRANVPATVFTLVLEGHVEVQVGRDGLKFEAGPFHHFGVQALEIAGKGDEDYVPDFTVRPVSECLVLIITCQQYLNAHKATMFQKSKDHESTSSIQVVNHHTSNDAAASVTPTRLTPTSSRTSAPKSEPVLKSLSAKKLRVGRGEKRSRKVEIQPLLSDSFSEEDEQEGDNTATNDSQPDISNLKSPSADVSLPTTSVAVEMHTIMDHGSVQSSDPDQSVFTPDPPRTNLDSSQL